MLRVLVFVFVCYSYAVARSDSSNRNTCYLFGKLRRTDFLPVGPDLDEEVFDRGYESMDTEEDERDEYAFAMQVSTNEMEDDLPDLIEADGNELADFM